MSTDYKDYLGDSVYVDYEDGMIRLYTSNGMYASNNIFLEPEVFQGLINYAKWLNSMSENAWLVKF